MISLEDKHDRFVDLTKAKLIQAQKDGNLLKYALGDSTEAPGMAVMG